MTGELDPGATVQVQTAAAQVKGVDGPDWVLACVLLVVDAHVNVGARMAYGYCEPMQWSPLRAALAGRTGRAGSAGAVDLAGHRPRPAGGLADLDRGPLRCRIRSGSWRS